MRLLKKRLSLGSGSSSKSKQSSGNSSNSKTSYPPPVVNSFRVVASSETPSFTPESSKSPEPASSQKTPSIVLTPDSTPPAVSHNQEQEKTVGFNNRSKATADNNGDDNTMSDEDEFYDAVEAVSMADTKLSAHSSTTSFSYVNRPSTAGQTSEMTTTTASSESSSNNNNSSNHLTSSIFKFQDTQNIRREDVLLSDDVLDKDFLDISRALDLFLCNNITEAEKICLQHAETHLYHSVGYSLIQAIKSLMSFDPEDFSNALASCRVTLRIAELLRQTAPSFMESAARWARGSSSVNSIKSMSRVERHAELVYAEALLLKSMLNILHSGDVFSLVKETLSVRTAYAIYTNLMKYLESCPSDEHDPHLISGVMLGNGCISLILSMLPGRVVKVVQALGYSGHRAEALAMLTKGSSMDTSSSSLPSSSKSRSTTAASSLSSNGNRGLRRPLCDLMLLSYHLVISSVVAVGDVDLDFARKILDHNLAKYPNGTFFLYYKGRLLSTETRALDAIESFNRAIDAQKEYIQLQHICYWELSISYMSLGNVAEAYKCYDVLQRESRWSKCCYTYAKGIMLYEMGTDPDEAAVILAQVPGLMQRIAGKSMPTEKFCARKIKKFTAQGNRLMLPGMEHAYLMSSLKVSPRFALNDTHIKLIEKNLEEMRPHLQNRAEWYGGESEFWDDWCLLHFLKGVVVKFIAFPLDNTHLDPEESPISKEAAFKISSESLSTVIDNSNNLVFDHYLAWAAHYELGMLHMAYGLDAKAKEHFTIVLNGKVETKGKVGGGKVSFQNAIILRSNAALETIQVNESKQKS